MARLLKNFKHALGTIADDEIQAVPLQEPLTHAFVVGFELLCILPSGVSNHLLKQFEHIEGCLPGCHNSTIKNAESYLLQPHVNYPIDFLFFKGITREHSRILHLQFLT